MNARGLKVAALACVLSTSGCGASNDESGGAEGAGTGGAAVVAGSGGSMALGGPAVIGTGGAVANGGAASGGAPPLPSGAGGAPVTSGIGGSRGGAGFGGAAGGAGFGGGAGAGFGGTAAAGSGGMGGLGGGAVVPDGGAPVNPCEGGMEGPASGDAASRTPVRGYGNVELNVSTKSRILSLETTLTVPTKPPANGTLFLWPGLQPLPGGANYNPIGNGVLQPVLTWGGTCAPTAPNSYASWWISAQYVNVSSSDPSYVGCKGGTGMTVAVGDELHIAMSLANTTWTEVVTDEQSGKMVSFDIDLKGQAQDWAIFSIEADGREPVSDVVFTGTVLTLDSSDPAACAPSTRGQTDYFAAPQASIDGKRCCIPKIVLRGQGVAATSPN